MAIAPLVYLYTMLRKLLVCFLLLLIFIPFVPKAQNTVGVLSRVDSLVYPGINLFYPHNQPNVYLLDNCGRIVHEWSDSSGFRPGNTAYLQENGDLFKTKRRAAIASDPIWGGGGGYWIEKRDWDNNLLWIYGRNDSLERLHHDFSVLPNGNVLMVIWEYKDSVETVNMGRDPNLLTEGKLWPDYLLELQPVGNDSFSIAWEWHSWDHLIQDFDSTKPNFGDPAQHPERIDINYIGESYGEADWHHINAVDYNPQLDQIMVSVPTFSEIWIIDHSTSIQEAAGSTGGNAGRGGDLLWRWGNPQAYSRGDSLDQQLFYQHDAHWMDLGLEATNADFNKVSVFNNNAGPNFSAVDILEPEWDANSNSYLMSGNTFAPATQAWRYTAPNPADFFSSRLSSAQRLPNGNTLIVQGRSGYTFEITPIEEIVWEYENPFVFGNAATQGDSVAEGTNIVFRLRRYPADYPAFQNRSLVGGAYLELDPDTASCTLPVVGREQPQVQETFTLWPQPAHNRLGLRLPEADVYRIDLLSLDGKQIKSYEKRGQELSLDLPDLAQGLYLIRVRGQHRVFTATKKLLIH